jgi:hypothetical protein
VLDELTKVATFMAHEMNTNAHGPACCRMRELNSFSGQDCVTAYIKAPWWRQLFGAISPEQCMDMQISSEEAALMMWAMKVRQNGEWDHKPTLHRFVSPTTHTFAWHAYAKTLYYYDIWSNIHYGYVGSAAGFDDGVLLDGAGLEQIGTDVLRRRWPRRSSGVEGLRAFDDASDRTAISLGIEFYSVIPGHITAPHLVQTIVMTGGLDTKPIP